MHIRDSQCGYTVLSREAADLLPLDKLWNRYGYPNDLLGMLAERKLRVSEVVVRPIYADEDSGIKLWHALFVVPFVLLRVLSRRLLHGLRGHDVHEAPACFEAHELRTAVTMVAPELE